MPVPETSDFTGYKICFQENQINLAFFGKWTHLNLTLQDSGMTFWCSAANHIIWRKRAFKCLTASCNQDNRPQQDNPSQKFQSHQNHGISDTFCAAESRKWAQVGLTSGKLDVMERTKQRGTSKEWKGGGLLMPDHEAGLKISLVSQTLCNFCG